jgi:DNA-binding CsgD family transcriptional regulator
MATLPCIDLRPLAADDAEEVVRTHAPEMVATVVKTIVDRGRGNPLALCELLRGLSIDQRMGRAAIDDPIPVATEVVLAYRRRIDGLPEDTRTGLLLAVAEGRGTLPCVLRALAASSLNGKVFEPAERDELISIRDGAVQFRHPLVRSVVYQTASPAQRRAAHALLAGVEPHEDRRAWHLASSVAEPTPVAAEAMIALAERALGRGADSTAAHALVRAAELTSPAEERGRLFAKAARAANRGGDSALASELLGRAAGLVGEDPIDRADLTLLDADLRMRRGDLQGAYLDLTKQAEAIAPFDLRRATAMLLTAAKLHVYRMEAAAGLASVRRAIELSGSDSLDLLQISSLAMTQTMAGDPGALATTLAAARAAMASTRGHLHTSGIAWPLVWLDEHELARHFLTWAIAAQRDGGCHSYLPQSLLPSAELDHRTGRWRQAAASAYEAHQLFIETGQPTEAAQAAGMIARLAATLGDDKECISHARSALEEDLASGLVVATSYAHAALGHLALADHRYDDAISSLLRAQSILDSGGVAEPALLSIDPDLVECLVRLGRGAEAEAITERLEQHAEQRGRGSLLAAAARCRALVAPADSFAHHFEVALDRHNSADAPFERARTELCFGQRLRRENRRADARMHLAAALETFDGLGAQRWSATAAAELRASGAQRAGRDLGTIPNGHTLTSRERDVAQRVADGATNKEVALQLFVNEKTIEFHLGNIYRKLGLRSRSELGRALNEPRQD